MRSFVLFLMLMLFFEDVEMDEVAHACLVLFSPFHPPGVPFLSVPSPCVVTDFLFLLVAPHAQEQACNESYIVVACMDPARSCNSVGIAASV